MKTLKTYITEALSVNEAKLPEAKPFKQVKVGEIAYDIYGDDKLGEIVWKGSFKDLMKSKYKKDVEDDMIEFIEDDSDIVVVDVPQYGAVVFQYDEDPSSAIVPK